MKSKGFTLIELLVVVAIIGILATVVLASFGSARDRARDARIRSGLNQIVLQAEVDYTGNYNNLCSTTSTTGIMFRNVLATAKVGPATAHCYSDIDLHYGHPGSSLTPIGAIGADSNGSIWAMTVYLHSNVWYCVDSLGNITEGTTRGISGSGATFDKTCTL